MAEKLREACVRGEAERVARLLDEGIKPQPDENGRSPLLLAAALGHTDVCNALLLREAEVNAADSVSDILGNEFVLIYEDRDRPDFLVPSGESASSTARKSRICELFVEGARPRTHRWMLCDVSKPVHNMYVRGHVRYAYVCTLVCDWNNDTSLTGVLLPPSMEDGREQHALILTVQRAHSSRRSSYLLRSEMLKITKKT
ncbi:ankyrin repeat domain-containing protein 6 isoform X5 [Vespula maculifrons]|uniref:Ankyrin repeat domain-containing protein 6 isoform X5 n=2 Tax=Vespula TaxID=7451 RepID=A0ABD2BLW1_VESMC